jgi:hypothetical protein
MPNVINYAEEWKDELLEVVIQGTLTSPFVTDNVKWLGAKTFHFTSMSTTGFKAHSRNGGWNRGTITQTDHPYTLEHDRDVEFLIDKLDVDESNLTASIEKVAANFVKTNAVPEIDARFYERVSEAAINATKATAKALNTYTAQTIIGDIKGAIDQVRRYRNSLIVYIRTELMSLLETALAGKASIAWSSVSDLEFSIETRVATVDGVPVFEVIDLDRFCTKFDYTTGFTKSSAASSVQTDTPWQKLAGKDLNILVASTQTVFTVHKIVSIYYFAPGEHTEGDGYLYQHREAWDTVVFPNGKTNAVDSVYIQYVN